MSKTDEILTYVIEMKEDIAQLKEHVKTQNGSVARNIKEIEKNRDCGVQLKIEQKGLIMKVAGITGGLVFVATAIINIGMRFI